MPKPRTSKLESPTARLKLAVRRKPYWITISPGIALGYRRNHGAGTWSVRCYSHGDEWIKRIALANDYEPPDDNNVLSYWQAIDKARAMVREATGRNGSRPLTVAEALDRYEKDLIARGAGAYNATHVRVHLTPVLAERLVAVLTADELIRWRDELLVAGMTPQNYNRMRKGLRAALNLVAERDPRITNGRAWKVGLKDLPDSHNARNVILSPTEVARLVHCAYEIDRRFGRFVEVLVVTGARPSQAARLTVGDLQSDRLMMPTSKKGRGRKIIHRYPTPIPSKLAAALADDANGRPLGGPLLLDPDGSAWGYNRRSHHKRKLFRQAVIAAELDPNVVTPYALRHSSIVRMLKRNIAIRLVASHHDTSVLMIERNYSAYIVAHSDELIRASLPDISPARAENVVPLAPSAGRRS
jgi:integrase